MSRRNNLRNLIRTIVREELRKFRSLRWVSSPLVCKKVQQASRALLWKHHVHRETTTY
ncbi:hypothetical protein V5799_025445, partial [Amblyomma americanum]